MRVCVFGGGGFIGSRVARCLANGGHEVVALVRSEQKGASLAQMGVHVRYGDVRNVDDVRSAIAGVDMVINVAVPSYRGRLGLRRVKAIAKQHMANVSTILREAQRAGDIPVVVSEGTLIWGDSGEGWLDETAAFNPLGMGRVGEWSTPHVQKLIAERNAPIIRMVPGMVYGAGSWFEHAVYGLMAKGWFRTFGDGQNVVSCVYVDDIAEAYRLAVEQAPLGEAFAIVDDHPVRFKDFANCVACVLGKPPVKSMPLWLGRLLAGRAMAETLTVNQSVKNAKAKARLGWNPRRVSCEQGIPEAVAEIETTRARGRRSSGAAPEH